MIDCSKLHQITNLKKILYTADFQIYITQNNYSKYYTISSPANIIMSACNFFKKY